MSILPLPARQRNYHEIIWIQTGTAKFRLDGDIIDLASSSVFLIPRGRMHQFLPDKDVGGKVIRFQEEFVQDLPHLLFSSFNQLAGLTLSEEDNAVFGAYFSLFENEYQCKEDGDKVLLKLLESILIKLEKLKTQQLECAQITQGILGTFIAFQQLMDDCIHSEHKVAFYADRLNVTTRKLGTICKSVLNKSTNQVLADRLVIQIKRELCYATVSISEIAYSLGFDDVSNFTKFFKKHVGITPLVYRKQNVLA